MDEILYALSDTLKSLGPTSIDPTYLGYVKGIYIWSEIESQHRLTVRHIPCILLSAVGENVVSGPFGNTQTRTFNVRIRQIARSLDSSKYKSKFNDYNSYNVTDTIRALLANNKQLGIGDGHLYGLKIENPTTDFETVFSAMSGTFLARDTNVTYDRLETWSGKYNNQPSLASPIPAPYKF